MAKAKKQIGVYASDGAALSKPTLRRAEEIFLEMADELAARYKGGSPVINKETAPHIWVRAKRRAEQEEVARG